MKGTPSRGSPGNETPSGIKAAFNEGRGGGMGKVAQVAGNGSKGSMGEACAHLKRMGKAETHMVKK